MKHTRKKIRKTKQYLTRLRNARSRKNKSIKQMRKTKRIMRGGNTFTPDYNTYDNMMRLKDAEEYLTKIKEKQEGINSARIEAWSRAKSIFSVDNKIHKKYAIALDDAVILSDIIIKQTKEYINNLMKQSKINTTTK